MNSVSSFLNFTISTHARSIHTPHNLTSLARWFESTWWLHQHQFRPVTSSLCNNKRWYILQPC